MTPDIQHHEKQHRFEFSVDGRAGLLAYSVHNGVMRLLHTEVDPALEGRGLAGALVQAALDHARDRGLKVDPACPYAATYMQRHPESMALRA